MWPLYRFFKSGHTINYFPLCGYFLYFLDTWGRLCICGHTMYLISVFNQRMATLEQ